MVYTSAVLAMALPSSSFHPWVVEAKLYGESKVIQRINCVCVLMITMMITKDDDKGDDKKLKDQSKNNSSDQDRIKNNSRLKRKVKSQESRFKVQDPKNQDQDSRLKIQESRECLIKISIKSFSKKLSST